VRVRFLSDGQREQLSGFPAELDGETLDRFFTLSDANLAEVPPALLTPLCASPLTHRLRFR
jgi:hypothetical protein